MQSCSAAAAVVHGVVDTPRSAACTLLGHLQHCTYNRLGSAAAMLLSTSDTARAHSPEQCRSHLRVVDKPVLSSAALHCRGFAKQVRHATRELHPRLMDIICHRYGLADGTSGQCLTVKQVWNRPVRTAALHDTLLAEWLFTSP